MKRFILTGLTTLTLAIAATPAIKAEPTAFNPYATTNPATAQLAPSALATLAYRGGLKDQGIPGYLNFTSDYTLGRVGAKEVVEGAIKANLLPASAADDRAYLKAVAQQLETQVRIR